MGDEDEQLTGIAKPHDHDVLSGRGSFLNHHAGNENFRKLVKHHKVAYVACPKSQKPIYSRIIYDEIRAMKPPGRFLKQDPKTKLWSDIGEKKALDKTRQALREGAPELLKEMEGGDNNDDGGKMKKKGGNIAQQQQLQEEIPLRMSNLSPEPTLIKLRNMSATSIMEAAIKAAEEMPNEQMNNEQIVAFAIDNADKIVQPLMPPDATKQQQQHMVNLQTNALIYTITAKQINNGTYIDDGKLSENMSACIWKSVEFGSGDKVVTFVGEVRISPEDFTKHGSNDGVLQLLKIMMSCEVYANQKGVRVCLANVFFSFGVDRRYADESTTRGEALLYMNQLKDIDGEVIVVATDSMRIHLKAKMVQHYEDDLRAINPNVKLRFIETWGLVDTVFDKSAEMLVPAAAKAAQDRQAALELLGELSTQQNPDKSIVVSGPDQQKQDDIRARGTEIQELYKGDGSSELKTHIKKTRELGDKLMDYLSKKKVDIIIEHEKKTITLLKLFREKWNSLAMKEDSETAATAFQQFYQENEAHMQGFLQRDDLPDIFDVNYVRTTKSEKRQPPDSQIGINYAAAEMDNKSDKLNRPNITIYDSGKDRSDIGNPGFVAMMVLICTGKVHRTVMLNPARASSEPTEDMLMMELFTRCNKSKDARQLFSKCIGKDAKELVKAEHARKKLVKGVHDLYDQEIRELVDKLVADIDKILYKEMSLIYQTRFSRKQIHDDKDTDEVV